MASSELRSILSSFCRFSDDSPDTDFLDFLSPSKIKRKFDCNTTVWLATHREVILTGQVYIGLWQCVVEELVSTLSQICALGNNEFQIQQQFNAWYCKSFKDIGK